MASLAVLQTIFDLHFRSCFLTDTCPFLLIILYLIKIKKNNFQHLEYEISPFLGNIILIIKTLLWLTPYICLLLL